VTPRECVIVMAPGMDPAAPLEIAIRLVVQPDDTTDTLIDRARKMLEDFRRK
jgi:hypothetical protein